ncbi:cysteine desulfurase [Caproiciproducens sp. NJN-50]|uniref:cysteine desulfurase family protein n=1 Tax=Acutalibacteraceae TaxID=3082771 RepID=UPI000FFE1AF9|nr:MULTISPECIES: cysteine desulfurase family protein [Acutalibacteraceae]QAT50532.1 cysteine desulfurase [Caproiciproducens sp. NJN-50]
MRIYADNAATTKLSGTALDAMLPYLTDRYGNPSSLHEDGAAAAAALLEARETMAGLLNCAARELSFTSGGSEADNQALLSAASWGAAHGRRHIVSTEFEHPAVLRTLEYLEARGFGVTLLPVSAEGIIRPEQVSSAIRPDTCLVSVMAANNEVGTVQPVKEIGDLCRRNNVLFHSDAVQAAGHIPIDLSEMNVDLLSLSAHKFHGPKGIGALYLRRGIRPVSLIRGGGQERGGRAGTENVPAVAGMAAALRESCGKLEENADYIARMREELISGLERIRGAYLIGGRSRRVPGIVNFCFEDVESEPLLLLLDADGISASAGSACSAGALEPSHVLRSMGVPDRLARGSLRLSLSEYNTPEEISRIILSVTSAVSRLRKENP